MSDELPELAKVRGYCEAPAKPDFFDQSLLLIGGKNPLGQPNLKVGWGWDLRIFRNGTDRALKYPGPFLDRWILEKWLAPEFFGKKKDWERNRFHRTGDGKRIDLLGDYPRQGQYGMVMPLTTPTGGFIPLGSDVLLFIDGMWATFSAQRLGVYSDVERFAKLQQQMAEEEAKMQEEAEREAQEWEDYVAPREFELNKEPKFSFPTTATIWTPDGEHPVKGTH